MIASLVVRFAERGAREVDRYGAWQAAVVRLREGWLKGTRPDPSALREYLADIHPDQRSTALCDLVGEHLRLGWQSGLGTHIEGYLTEFGREFPELNSGAAAVGDLIEDEFLARHQMPFGDTPPLAEYQQRFSTHAAVVTDLAARQLSGGRYVRLRKLGQGAMGEVWEGCDTHLRRLVAVKHPRANVTDAAAVGQRFAGEALLTAGLEHAGIVSIHEFHERADPLPFYVMRLVEGQPLNDRLREYHQPPATQTPEQRRLLWDHLLRGVVMVCDAIAHAHGRGVLHRDLKPANVLMGAHGEAVILDWGMATRFDNAGPAPGFNDTHIVGTPDYMPPEQADGRAEVRSDVFGLGAILYEVLTGRSPHGWSETGRPADWRARVREAQFEAPRQVEPSAPRALEAICLKALAHEPDLRYSTAEQLGDDLRRHLAGELVSVWPEPAWRRGARRLLDA